MRDETHIFHKDALSLIERRSPTKLERTSLSGDVFQTVLMEHMGPIPHLGISVRWQNKKSALRRISLKYGCKPRFVSYMLEMHIVSYRFAIGVFGVRLQS